MEQNRPKRKEIFFFCEATAIEASGLCGLEPSLLYTIIVTVFIIGGPNEGRIWPLGCSGAAELFLDWAGTYTTKMS